ncbi:MAG TPA: excinuclease ABC subunit UvrB [bacterium]|nr:excinuclease ABC subunit UvrB [bacterium]
MDFRLVSKFEPKGDQPEAIRELVEGLRLGRRWQTLLGVTGSGKTFTMASTIAQIGLPTLVISHNKTLAAQLYGEFRSFFPENAVEYFISYYDYYQPEAYIPSTDTYIEKDASINEDIDKLRLKATASVLERSDVLVVASVSCIYGIGSPDDFKGMLLTLSKGATAPRDEILRRLVDIQYTRNDYEPVRGTFRVRGDTLEIRPSDQENAVRVEMFGDEITQISVVDSVTGKTLAHRDKVNIYPSKHFVMPYERMEKAITSIEAELEVSLAAFRKEGRLLEAQRLQSRTRYDIEMLREIGYCPGIENYSRHLSGRTAGEPPCTLVDYFPEEFLLVIDESHVTVPQLRGMYEGDRSRKSTLVKYGFRLPSALDNRPLKFDEFEVKIHRAVFVSATPSAYEVEQCGGVIVEQVIRPTGLIDPEIVLRPVKGQIDDLLGEIHKVVARHERVLVTTLTKRMAEDLTDYLVSLGISARYLHSDIGALERVEILRGLRLKEFDVIVGINLLREGLDLPEVSLVAVLDADKEGFLRSETSLIQVAGRAARNVSGKVILYADTVTGSMQRAMDETNRRRKIQLAYNKKHGIVPQTIVKTAEEILQATYVADSVREAAEPVDMIQSTSYEEMLADLEREMIAAAKNLEFEKAASLRDRMEEVITMMTMEGKRPERPRTKARRARRR